MGTAQARLLKGATVLVNQRGLEELSMSDLATLAESATVDPLVSHPAEFHVFHQFLERCKALPPITTSVCWPCSDVALRGAVEAVDAGIILPTLVGPEGRLRALAKKVGVDISGYPIVDAATEDEAAQMSVAMCRDGPGAGDDERQSAHR